MSHVVVYSVNTGNYDQGCPTIVEEPGIQYVMFTDGWKAPPPWETIVFDNRAGLNNRRYSRLPKILAHKYLPPHDISIYCDAGFNFFQPVSRFMLHQLGDNDIAAIANTWHPTVEHEASAIMRHGMDTLEDVEGQLERQQQRGAPKGMACTLAGLLIRRNTPQIVRFNEAWWKEYVFGSQRDMLAMPYALWHTGTTIRRFHLPLDANWLFSRDLHTQKHRVISPLKIVTASTPKYDHIFEISEKKNRSLGYEVFCSHGGEEYEKIVYKSQHPIRQCAWKIGVMDKFVKRIKPFSTFGVWIDADAYAIRNFDEAANSDYDIGFTLRRPADRNLTKFRIAYGYLNTGVVFLNTTDKCQEFLALWQKECADNPGMSDQEAANRLILKCDRLENADGHVAWLGDIRIKIFPTDLYNFINAPEEPGPETKIVHFKSLWRDLELMKKWAERQW